MAIITIMTACSPTERRASAAAQAPCTLASTDEEAIRAVEQVHEADVLAANWDAVGRFYAPDIVHTPPNQTEITGRDTLVASLKTFPPITDYDLSFDEVEGCGDLAYVKGRYSMAFRPADAAGLVRDTGRWLWILRKDPAGRWLLTRDIFNSDQPVATGD